MFPSFVVSHGIAAKTGIVGVVTASALVFTAPSALASVSGRYTASGVRIRSCPNTTCTVYGLGYPGQSVTIYCYKTGTVVNGSPYWYYHRDNTTGVTGYSSDAYMDFNGSVSHC